MADIVRIPEELSHAGWAPCRIERMTGCGRFFEEGRFYQTVMREDICVLRLDHLIGQEGMDDQAGKELGVEKG